MRRPIFIWPFAFRLFALCSWGRHRLPSPLLEEERKIAIPSAVTDYAASSDDEAASRSRAPRNDITDESGCSRPVR
ncbi:hypothetical protein EJ06DRAFT_527433 [Trichodelitschia bisporula]|uniref:Secreted protein n=1 Tax=Trichodelitschia bisporula TaxID=703511 RepID=A0A6G1I6A8_9PEZI|nr:hypothetical protein EJ06DRAFT_527433 [Trichodelitschia bisporula]